MENDPKDEKIIWKNPRPSSTRYCRPLRLQFAKETAQIKIKHSLQLTMVEGKICSALSHTSSSKCYICEAKPIEMNDLEHCLKKKVNESRFEFGLSPLHYYIRFFEYFLHVSYRLDLKSWRVSTPEGRQVLSTRKFKCRMIFAYEWELLWIHLGVEDSQYLALPPEGVLSGTPQVPHQAIRSPSQYLVLPPPIQIPTTGSTLLDKFLV